MSVNASVSHDVAAIALLDSKGLGGDELAVALLAQTMDCIKILSIDGHLDFINCNGLAAMEVDDAQSLLGQLWWEIWPAPSRDLVQRKFREALLGSSARFEAVCPTAKGAYRRWSVDLRPLFARGGPIVSILATSRDITADA